MNSDFDKFDVVEVFWRDACTEDPWKAIEHVQTTELQAVKTVGYFLAEFPDRWIVMASRHTGEGVHDVASAWVIPKMRGHTIRLVEKYDPSN